MVLGVSKNDLLQDLWWPPLGLNYWFATRLAGLKSWLHSRLHQNCWLWTNGGFYLPLIVAETAIDIPGLIPIFYRFRFEIYFFCLWHASKPACIVFLATQSFHTGLIDLHHMIKRSNPMARLVWHRPSSPRWKPGETSGDDAGWQGHLLRVWEGAGRRGSRRGLKLSVAMNIAKKRFLITNSGLLMPKVGLGLYEFIWFYTLVSKV